MRFIAEFDGLGAQLAAKQAGLPLEIGIRQDDVLLVSISTWRQFPWIAKIRKANPHATIVVGGQGVARATPIRKIVDAVAYGDAEATIPPILSALERGLPIPSFEGRYELAKNAHIGEPVRVKGKTVWEAARGCKGRCKFCSVSKDYREASRDIVEVNLAAHPKGKPFAPNIPMCSHADLIMGTHKQIGMEMTPAAALKYAGRFNVTKLIVGVEGTSERLRRLAGKAVSNAKLLEMASAWKHAKILHMYLIPGLPTETDTDRAEFASLLDDMSDAFGGHINVSATLFQPIPGSAWQGEDGHWNREAYAWVHDMIRKGKAYHQKTGKLQLFSWPKGKELHEHDVVLCRAPDSASEYLMQYVHAHVRDGRWRGSFERYAGVSVESLLEKQAGM